jgi:hypothetical protein
MVCQQRVQNAALLNVSIGSVKIRICMSSDGPSVCEEASLKFFPYLKLEQNPQRQVKSELEKEWLRLSITLGPHPYRLSCHRQASSRSAQKPLSILNLPGTFTSLQRKTHGTHWKLGKRQLKGITRGLYQP